MDKDTLLLLLDRPIVVHRVLVTIAGNFTAAGFLGQAIYWTGKGADPEGWFYKKGEEWFEETGITIDAQISARKRLVSLGVLEESKAFVHARLHFRINFERLSELISATKNDPKTSTKIEVSNDKDEPKTGTDNPKSTFGNSQKCNKEFRKVKSGKPESKIGNSPNSYTEITSEITSEITLSETLNVTDRDNFVVLDDEGKEPEHEVRVSKHVRTVALKVVQELRDFGSQKRHEQLVSICDENSLMPLIDQALQATRQRQADEKRLGVLERPARYYDATLVRLLTEEGIHVPRKAQERETLTEMCDVLGLSPDASQEEIREALRRSMLGAEEAA